MVALRKRCGGSYSGDVVAHIQEMWWLIFRRCGGSYSGDVVAHNQEMGWPTGTSMALYWMCDTSFKGLLLHGEDLL